MVQLSQRDIDGLLLCGEHFGAPFDLLATALEVEPERLSALTTRWRRAGFAATGRLGPGPKWCWLTRDGMTATGLGFRAGPPALARLAHVRAILAARLWMESSPAWHAGRPWWHSERRLLAGQPAADRAEHLPDAEIHWPSLDGSPYAGQIWAIEVELTPKSAGRTTRIMTGLLAPMQYALVVYLTAARARPVVTRAAGSLPPGEQARLVVRDLPGYAFAPRGSLPAGGPIVPLAGRSWSSRGGWRFPADWVDVPLVCIEPAQWHIDPYAEYTDGAAFADGAAVTGVTGVGTRRHALRPGAGRRSAAPIRRSRRR